MSVKSDPASVAYRDHIGQIAHEDAMLVLKKDLEYGASWKRYGGQGAFFVMIRKVHRMEEQCKRHGYDVFAAILDKTTGESLADTIRDLRCYLDLIEAETRVMSGQTPPTVTRVEPSVSDHPCASCFHARSRHHKNRCEEQYRKDGVVNGLIMNCNCSGYEDPNQQASMTDLEFRDAAEMKRG